MERIGVFLFLWIGLFSISAHGYELQLAKKLVSKMMDTASSFMGKQRQSEISLDLPENAFPIQIPETSYSCKGDGLFPYPRDCTLGVRCLGGMDTIFSCTDVLHFNNVTKMCESFCSAQCDPLLACICGWDTCHSKETSTAVESETEEPAANMLKIPVICDTDGFFPSPIDCNRYVQCRNGRALLKMCPSGLHFNEDTKRCDAPCNAKCDPNIPCKLKSSEKSNEQKGIEEDEVQKSYTCRQDGLFADPNHCSQFIQCVHGRPMFFMCPTGLHFNKKTKRCDTPCNAKCDPKISCKGQSSHSETTETPSTSETSIFDEFTTIEGEESTKKVFILKMKFVCFDDGLFSNPKDCNKYVNCSNGNYYEMSCPSGKHFNSRTGRCDAPCSAKCDPNLICKWKVFKNKFQETIIKGAIDSLCSEDGMYANPISCEAYFRCEGGDINAYLCPNGQHFSERNLQCEEPCTARCNSTLAEKCDWDSTTETDLENNVQEPVEELCSKDGAYKERNPIDCETYFRCDYGDALLLHCPEGQHFNKETLHCEEPCSAHCDSSIAEKCGWEQTTKPENDNSMTQPIFYFQCPENGLFANTACESFIQCTGGQAYLINCPYGQHFEPYTQRCTTPCEARCAENYEEYCKDQETKHSPKHILEDFVCVTDGYQANPADCRSFLQCFAGSAYVIPCPGDLHYSPTLEICMTPCDAKCVSNYEEYCKADEWSRRRRVSFPRSKSEKQSFPLVSEFICIGDGIYPNPEECTSYIQCTMGESSTKDCPKGLHFSEKTLKCESPCDAQCDPSIGAICGFRKIKTSSKSSEETFSPEMFLSSDSPSLMYHFTCMKDGVYKNPENCSSFIQCAGGHSYVMACPAGLHFNEEIMGCDYRCSARCDIKLACDCGWETCGNNEEKPAEVDCEAGLEEGPCAEKLPRYAYDASSGRCRGFYYGGCEGNSNNFKTLEECEEKCQQKLLRGFKCPTESGMFGHYPDCLSYYHCKRGIPTLKKCPKGTAFDHKKSKCVVEYEALCEFLCREENAVYPYDEDCHMYIDCVNGISKLEKCPPGKAFNPQQKDCIDEKLVDTCY